MSENQLLTVPAVQLPEDDGENQLVERFMEASRDLVPSVQITLAKRIIRPGSNKVICLAAKTSIPLRDDELASVSDLALKLSDGTNVALSLSFFNDGGGEYSPLKRYVYSPADYKKKNGSSLGFVLIGMGMVFVAGSFALINKQYVNALPPLARNAGLAQIASIAGIGFTKETAKPIADAAVKAGAKSAAATAAVTAPSTTSVSSSTKHEGTRAASVKGSNWFSKFKSGSSHSHSAKAATPGNTFHEAHGQTLVPPPPPTTPYIMPYGSQIPFFDPRAGYHQPPQNVETQKTPSVKAQKSADAVKTASNKSAEPKSSEQKIQQAQKAPELKVVPAIDAADMRVQSQPQDVSIIEPKIYRTRDTAYWPATQTAPTPGGDSSNIQLERIVPRAQPSLAPSTTGQSSDNF